jgi:hypothetical protein
MGRLRPFANPSGKARFLREADGWSRRIVLKNSEIEAPRKSRFRARHVISTGSPHGTAYGSGVRGNARLSADPLRNFSSWLPAVL